MLVVMILKILIDSTENSVILFIPIFRSFHGDSRLEYLKSSQLTYGPLEIIIDIIIMILTYLHSLQKRFAPSNAAAALTLYRPNKFLHEKNLKMCAAGNEDSRYYWDRKNVTILKLVCATAIFVHLATPPNPLNQTEATESVDAVATKVRRGRSALKMSIRIAAAFKVL